MKTFTPLYRHFTMLASAVLLAVSSVAQNFTISGTVLDGNNQPVPNQTVQIVADSSNGVYYWGWATTAANGTYSYVVTNGSQSGVNQNYFVIVNACNQTYTQTAMNNQGTSSSAVIDFSVCPLTFCVADFTPNPVSGTTVVNFTNNSSGAGITYLWDFGDGNTATNQHPTHTYANFGTYTVTLTITNGTCTDQQTTTVTLVQPPPPCQTTWAHSTSGLTASFWHGSVPSGSTLTWDFGDGNTSNAFTPSHVYAAAGTYTVSFTVNDNAGCVITQTQSVTVINAHRVRGSVLKSQTGARDCRVYLIKYDPNASGGPTLTAVDSVDLSVLDSGNYEFLNVLAGSYLIKAALLPADPDYTSYVPTYHLSHLFWSGATTVNTNSTTSSGLKNVVLIQGTNTGGSGFIGGLISQGANKSGGPGDPVANQLVILLNANGDPVSYVYSDANGEYAFENIPFGTYTIYAEAWGKETFPPEITLNGLKPRAKTVNLKVHETMITADAGSWAVSNNQLTSHALELTVFPNPADQVATVRIETEWSQTLQLTVVNALGAEMLQEKHALTPGENRIDLGVDALAPGMYFVKVAIPDNSVLRVITLLKK